MKKALFVAAGFMVFGAASAMAQGGGLNAPTCPNGTQSQQIAQDACQQAYDLFQFLAPQLGTAIAGGNATIGQGSTLGGFGHFSIGVRVNAVQGAYPDVTTFTQRTSGASPARTLPTKDQFIPFPTADAAVGILGGIPLGVTNVLAVDALVSATYVPTITQNSVTVTPSQNLQLGYGGRVGILQESIVVPGVSVTYLKRDLPTISMQGTSGNNTLSINNATVKTTAWRAVVSKSLVVFGFAAGAGKDTYDEKADISATVNNIVGIPGVTQGTAQVPGTSQSLDRTTYFGDISLNLPLFKIVAEAGQVSGGTVNTYNSFSAGRADRSLQYYSVGLRLGF